MFDIADDTDDMLRSVFNINVYLYSDTNGKGFIKL